MTRPHKEPFQNVQIAEVPAVSRASYVPGIPRQADSDDHLMQLWLHGRSSHTVDAYTRDIRQFKKYVGCALHEVTLGDLQDYVDQLATYADTTRARKIASVKSLFSFGHRLGYLPFDAGAPLKTPSIKDTLAERILDQKEIHMILDTERNQRNHAILRLFYGSGIRVSELTQLRWRDLKKRRNTGQLTVYGKGGKTRFVLLSPDTFAEIKQLDIDSNPDSPIFRSKKGGHLDRSQVYRIVRRSAEKAGLWQKVSPHWMRHAHASHALDKGAPIHLVQTTLGHASVATTGRYTHARPDASSGDYLDI